MRARGDFTVDRLAEQAPEAVELARAAILALPRSLFGLLQRRDKLVVLKTLNKALAEKGLGSVTYSMLDGWANAVIRAQKVWLESSAKTS